MTTISKEKAHTTEGFTSMLSIHQRATFNQVQWPLEDSTELLLAALWLEDNLRRVYHALGLNVSVKKFRGKSGQSGVRGGVYIFFDQNISRIL